MGPQHPATHGVLRLVLELEGEVILNLEPVIGYLHTGFEKEMETRTYHQNIVFPPRIEYLATFIEEQAYVLAVEKLLGVTAPKRAEVIRLILAELSRIASHLVYLGTAAIDLNVTSLLMYCFRDREEILDIFEMVSGQRMMHGYFRIGGLQWDLPQGFAEHVQRFLDDFPRRLDEYETLLTDNLIWRKRTEGVAVLSAEDAIRYGCTGPVLRGSGVSYDVRKAFPSAGGRGVCLGRISAGGERLLSRQRRQQPPGPGASALSIVQQSPGAAGDALPWYRGRRRGGHCVHRYCVGRRGQMTDGNAETL